MSVFFFGVLGGKALTREIAFFPLWFSLSTVELPAKMADSSGDSRQFTS